MRRLVKSIAACALAGPLFALAAGGATADDGAPLLELSPGQTVALCKAGLTLCPAIGVCDDTKVAVTDSTEEGLVLRARAPGETLCSAASASGRGARHVFRVVVRK